VAVATAGQYENLHLPPEDNQTSIPLSLFNRPDALPAIQPTASKH